MIISVILFLDSAQTKWIQKDLEKNKLTNANKIDINSILIFQITLKNMKKSSFTESKCYYLCIYSLFDLSDQGENIEKSLAGRFCG